MKNPPPYLRPVYLPLPTLCALSSLARAWRFHGWLNATLFVCGLLGQGSPASGQMTAVIDTAAYRTGAIEGFVTNALTGKPVAGVTVSVTGAAASIVTDQEGAFRLRNLPPGTRSLIIVAEGLRSVSVEEIAVRPGRTVRLRPVDLHPMPVDGVEKLGMFYVNASQLVGGAEFAISVVPLAHLVVVPSHYAISEDAVASNANLRREDLERLPLKGEDLFRAIARLPGLATSETATRFWVRGAPNDQVLTRFDGVELLEPFHVKGFDGALSVVDLETVDRLDLTTGGFTAKYGNRLAGVLTIETESFDAAGARNTLGASLTSSRAISRGEFADGRGSWLVEGRLGYPGLFVGNFDQNGGDLETAYSDFTAKVEYRLTPAQDVSLHFLHTRDRLDFNDVATPYLNSDYGSDYLWGRWRVQFGERLYGETVLSLGYLSWRHREAGSVGQGYTVALKDNRDLTTTELRQDWTLLFSDHALLQGGFEVTSGESTYAYFLERHGVILEPGTLALIPGELVREDQRRVKGQSGGVYLAPRWSVNPRLTLEPSVRLDGADFTHDAEVSPRFNAALALGRTTLRAAWGRYSQSQGLHQLGIADEDRVFHRAERAEHRVLSWEHRSVPGIELRAEAYERRLSRLRPHSENLVNVDEAFPELRYERRLLGPTSGLARGIELTAQNREPSRFNWALSYALATTKERIGDRDLPRPRDQRHTFALDLGYAPNPKWRLSAAWQYHTGWPTTEVIFHDVALPSGERVVIGEIGPSYSQRLPAYHRLDLRVTRLLYVNKTTLRLFADLFNAYDRKNVQGYDYSPVLLESRIATIKKAQIQMCLMPNLGAVWEF